MSRREPQPERSVERSPAPAGDVRSTLRTVGTYRTVESKYLNADSVERLHKAGMVKRVTFPVQATRERMEAVVLTRAGQQALEQERGPDDGQRYMAGAIQPREMEHDLAVYPACRDEIKAIEAAGGRVARVITSNEFKSITAKHVNRTGYGGMERRRREIAEKLNLPIADGKLAIPDARIEFEDANGVEKHLDVEVVTRNYSAGRVASLQKSGFKIAGAQGNRAPVRDDHKIGWI